MTQHVVHLHQRCRPLVVAALLLVLLGSAIYAQEGPSADRMELTRPVLRTLARLQEDWLEWLTAFYGGDRERADAALSSLLSNCEELGMSTLPNLSLGASASALRFARAGDFERAQWGLQAAQRLAPQRPEVSFAAARVESLQGSVVEALKHWVVGFVRSFRLPLERNFWINNVILWGLCVLLLTGGAFIALEMGTRGVFLFGDLVKVFSRALPRFMAFGLALGVLIWPVALPAGLLWLMIYWSILLWHYAGASERFFMIVVWALLIASPVIVERQRRKLEVQVTPSVVTMDSVVAGHLYGDLFTDLDQLRSALPESVAAIHLVADVHGKLDQWEAARALYLGVVENEPQSRSALNDTGVTYYQRGEFDRSIDYFRRAAEVLPPHPAPHFNLSQVYSDTYRFSAAGSELETAQELDDASVGRWIQEASVDRVVTLDGGLSRTGEIEEELLDSWGGGRLVGVWLDQWRLPLMLPLIFVFLIFSLVFRIQARPRWRRSVRAGDVDRGNWDYLARLIPGFSEAEMGYWGQAFVGLLIPVSLATLPLMEHIGFRIPWIFGAGSFGMWLVCGAGLAIYFIYRLMFR